MPSNSRAKKNEESSQQKEKVLYHVGIMVIECVLMVIAMGSVATMYVLLSPMVVVKTITTLTADTDSRLPPVDGRTFDDIEYILVDDRRQQRRGIIGRILQRRRNRSKQREVLRLQRRENREFVICIITYIFRELRKEPEPNKRQPDNRSDYIKPQFPGHNARGHFRRGLALARGALMRSRMPLVAVHNDGVGEYRCFRKQRDH